MPNRESRPDSELAIAIVDRIGTQATCDLRLRDQPIIPDTNRSADIEFAL